jgi:hypothetical protein
MWYNVLMRINIKTKTFKYHLIKILKFCRKITMKTLGKKIKISH